MLCSRRDANSRADYLSRQQQWDLSKVIYSDGGEYYTKQNASAHTAS